MEGKGSKGRRKVVFHRVWTGCGRPARGASSGGRGGGRSGADETRLAGGRGNADAKCARIVHFVTGLSRAGGLLVGAEVVECATGMSARSRGRFGSGWCARRNGVVSPCRPVAHAGRRKAAETEGSIHRSG